MVRLKILKDDKKNFYFIKQQPKLYASTKQELFKLIKIELDVKRINIRRNSISYK